MTPLAPTASDTKSRFSLNGGREDPERFCAEVRRPTRLNGQLSIASQLNECWPRPVPGSL